MKLKKHNVYTTSAVPLGFILLIMWCCNLSDLFNVFDILCFVLFFCLRHYKGQGQWVIKYYINIYERKRRWFVIQSLKWARGWKSKDDPSHLDGKFNFSLHTHAHAHTLSHTHAQFSLLTSQSRPQLTLCLKHISFLDTMDGRCNVHHELPITGHHDSDVWIDQPQWNNWICL